MIECPIHPGYTAKIRPAMPCKACRLMFDVRNNANRIASVPRDERDALDEIIVRGTE